MSLILNRRKAFRVCANLCMATAYYFLSSSPRNSLSLWKPEFSGENLVRRLFQDADSAKRLGRKYLQLADSYMSRQDLTKSIFQGRQYDKEKLHDQDHARSVLTDLIRADFKSGDVVMIDGWVMSRTELSLCAIAYLDHIAFG